MPGRQKPAGTNGTTWSKNPRIRAEVKARRKAQDTDWRTRRPSWEQTPDTPEGEPPCTNCS